jgi:hypothetical protein
MAKAKHSPRLSQAARRNLFIVAVILITLGLMNFFLQVRSKKMAEMQTFEQQNENTYGKAPSNIGPDKGCTEDKGDYVCDIKITNPSQADLNWSAMIEDIDGASVSPNSSGTLTSGDSTMVQFVVPQMFCNENPAGKGKITIMDNAKSSNQSEAEFTCNTD